MFTDGYNRIKEAVGELASKTRSKIDSNLMPINDKLPYAYPCDNYINSIFSVPLVRKSLQFIIDKYYKNQIKDIELSGFEVTQENYPNINNIYNDCCKTLKVINPPMLTITTKLQGINALSVESEKQSMILISRKAIACLTESEMRFMLGHELGHILQGNLICHTVKGLLDNLSGYSEILSPMISDLIDTPLNNWHRCAEYTADRAGLICCKDLSVVKKIFSRISYSDCKSVFNLDEYVELSSSYPLLKKRWKCLTEFHRNSNLYK